MTALFVQGRFRYDMIALGGLLVLAVTGVLPAKDVFSGLAHPVILTVGAVLLLSQGLQNCGVVDAVANRVASLGWRPSLQIALLVVLVTVLSAFVNNIGALSLLLPVGLRLAKRHAIAPSSFLMCLAFGAILGGLFCLISTPVNLLISGIRATTLGEGFGFFDFTPVGMCVIAVGLLYMLGPGRRLLPHYPDAQESGGFLDMGAYASELVVKDDSSIAGQTLAQISAFRDHHVVVASIVRAGKAHRRIDGSTEVLAGDRLIVECDPTNLSEATAATGTELVTPEQPSEQEAIGWEVLEAVVPPGSELVGKTAREVNLRYQFGLNLVGVARKGARIRTRLSHTPFKAGDILLLQGAAPAFRQAAEELGLLQLATRDLLSPPHLRPMWLGLSIFVGTILLAAFSILPVEQAFVLGAFLMIASGALPSQQAYTVIDLPLLILLACMLPLGKALETSGAAATLAHGLVTVSGQLPDRGILVVFVGLTALLANLMNNKAATAIMAPLAIKLAGELGWNPDTLLMGAAVGAELVFLSPVGHQCNLLVLGPGSYSFKDFLRFGVPMVLLGLAAAVIALPIFWPPH
jgi:di/tricarboxylate transporter